MELGRCGRRRGGTGGISTSGGLSVVVLAVLLGATAVIALTGHSSDRHADTGSTTATRSPTPGLTGDLVVDGAASLTNAFNAVRSTITMANPDVHLTVDFGSSSLLATQIINGAPADVFASADVAQMARVVAAGKARHPVAFARNRLEIVVAPGNPRHVTSIADLDQAAGANNADKHIRVGLAAAGVPARTYADQMFEAHHETVAPDATGPDVVATLHLVTAGQVDAAIVYATDAQRAGKDVMSIAIPTADNVIATYEIVVLADGPHPTAALAFVRSAVSGDVQRTLRAFGFGAP